MPPIKNRGMILAFLMKIVTYRRPQEKREEKSKGLSKEGDFNSDISLEDVLIDVDISLSILNPDASGLVHRIDSGTSG
eukprot:scaffold224_cov276-Chaetoceros_neogracile.AAC.66